MQWYATGSVATKVSRPTQRCVAGTQLGRGHGSLRKIHAARKICTHAPSAASVANQTLRWTGSVKKRWKYPFGLLVSACAAAKPTTSETSAPPSTGARSHDAERVPRAGGAAALAMWRLEHASDSGIKYS